MQDRDTVEDAEPRPSAEPNAFDGSQPAWEGAEIVDADLILVLRDGRIVEQGRHRDLLEKKGFYHEIYKSQYDIA